MSSRRSLPLPAVLVVAGALLLAACGSSDPLGGKVIEDGVSCTSEVTIKADDVPTVAKVAETPKKLVKKDLTKAAKGCAADTTSFLTLSLVGATASDGKVFTDTFDEKRPITAKLGTGTLLPGLEAGVEGMKVGGRRQITIPAAQAYGKDGNIAQGIGPDAALVFVVDLVAVTPKVLYCNAANGIPAGAAGAGKPTTVDMPLKAPVELKKTDLKKGTGKAAEKGNYVTVQYLGIACSTGQQFDSSWDKGEPFPITLGEGTIAGFATGIAGMKVGGVRQIDIPSALAYGTAGQGSIGADEPLTFVIEVTALAEKPPATTTTTLPTETSTTVAGDETTTTAAGDAATTTTAAEATTTTEAKATTTTGG